ncbi:sigma-70 family RNA polymerase sigma factor [Methylomonas sp. LL1]|uniref:sigma-70 family RNA polymerase sigma factor n=1 Tax=Methylomonas sp. LL1 TaxID=2785785 RepID=UPI0018C42CC1|nr:sigma-70 family RNA polymerase sigma factor [Methylomonas sp. LL1]QPK64426.1 sigma-70 family RNA polymerase sigma factor [Methylomonas sp. LL1]
MPALSEIITATTPALESEQVLLAFRVERARGLLVSLLLENQQVIGFIAKQLFDGLSKSQDYSEIILIKNNPDYKHRLQDFIAEFSGQHRPDRLCQYKRNGGDNVVQESVFLQLDNPFSHLSESVYASLCLCLQALHFLPVYLIEVSESIEKNPNLVAELDVGYKTKLRSYRLELKQLRQAMIAGNTGLVAFVAYKFRASSLSFDDLMQEGLVGLIKAVDRFEPDRGNCFSTYAIFWIRQAISRLIVKQDKVVPLPVALAEKSSPIFEAMRNCYTQHERWPSLAELKACCDLSEQEIKTISGYYQSTFSYDTNAHTDDDGMSMMEKMQQQQFSQPLDDLIESDLARFVNKAVATLPEKQASILAMRFGLKNHTEMTLQAVADHLQVTRERVRQIQNEALKKLEQQFGFDLMLFLEPKDT